MNRAQHEAWETIQRAHAIANGVFVVVVNRVGREGQLTFWGQSFVADPFGRIVAKAASDRRGKRCSPSSICRASRKHVRTGRSCATGASTPTDRLLPRGRLIDAEPRHRVTPPPAALGYRMPAEWYPHDATWLSWPKDPETWPGPRAAGREIFLRMIELLAEHETVNLLVDDDEAAECIALRARLTWPQAVNVRLHLVPTVDSWIRDYGPELPRPRSRPDRAGLSTAARERRLQRLGIQRVGREVPDVDGRHRGAGACSRRFSRMPRFHARPGPRRRIDRGQRRRAGR